MVKVTELKNMKLTSFDGGLTWYPQVYDADTCIGLDKQLSN